MTVSKFDKENDIFFVKKTQTNRSLEKKENCRWEQTTLEYSSTNPPGNDRDDRYYGVW